MGAGRDLSTRGRAFGLDLEVHFDCPGLPPAAPAARAGPSPVHVELSTERLAAAFPAGAERIWQLESSDGTVLAHYDADHEAGYLLTAAGYGSFVIRPDRSRVLCDPEPDGGPAWRWQRYLVGQVLPFVAVLHGLEVFHASVVIVDTAAVAFLGASGAGKSSIAAGCVLRGGRYVTDDVMALRAESSNDDAICAQSGFGLASLRNDLVRRLDGEAIARLGTPVGEDEEALRLAIEVPGEAVPIAGCYFLERREAGEPGAIERCDPVDPRRLLASSYNFVLRDRDRLTRQLDICAQLAHRIPLFRLPILPGVGPLEVAERVDRHVTSIAA
jgi:hypothetical protein